MAGFVDKFKNMWNPPEDDYDDYGYELEGESNQDYEDDFSSDEEYRRSDRTERSERSERHRSSYSNYESGNKVVNISASTKIQVILFKPDRFDDETRSIADELIKNRTVVLNLEDANGDMSRRILDFLSGVTYSKQGKIKRVAKSTYIIMPENVDFTGDDLLDELENSGVYF